MQESRRSHADWRALLKGLRDADRDFDLAEQWAREDINLAQQAHAAIAEAQRSIQVAGSYYQSGISVNVHSAEDKLRQARHQLNSQNYEQAIEMAGYAEQEARKAHDRALQEVRQRQEAIRYKRLQQAATAIGAGMILKGGGRRGFPQMGRKSRSTHAGNVRTRPWASGSRSSGSSWSGGGSSQSNW